MGFLKTKIKRKHLIVTFVFDPKCIKESHDKCLQFPGQSWEMDLNHHHYSVRIISVFMLEQFWSHGCSTFLIDQVH